MRERSYTVAGYWAGLVAACFIGNTVMFYGFGTASERLNKRIRDSSFLALLRQEVAFFDKRSVGSITSQLQDDAARIHAFSGEPIRTVISALGSVAIGVIIALFVSSSLPLARRLFRFQTSDFSVNRGAVYVASCSRHNRLYPYHGLRYERANEANVRRRRRKEDR